MSRWPIPRVVIVDIHAPRGLGRRSSFYPRCKRQTGWGWIESRSYKKSHGAWTVLPDGLWFSSATGGLHYTPEYQVHLWVPEPFEYVVSGIRHAVVRDTRGRIIDDSARWGCRYALIHLIHQKDLQSLLFKCHFLFHFLTKTIPFMNTAAHCRHIRTPGKLLCAK